MKSITALSSLLLIKQWNKVNAGFIINQVRQIFWERAVRSRRKVGI